MHALGLKNSGSFKNNLHGIKLSVFHSIEDFLSFFKKNDKFDLCTKGEKQQRLQLPKNIQSVTCAEGCGPRCVRLVKGVV